MHTGELFRVKYPFMNGKSQWWPLPGKTSIHLRSQSWLSCMSAFVCQEEMCVGSTRQLNCHDSRVELTCATLELGECMSFHIRR